jgi:hypothetical protein
MDWYRTDFRGILLELMRTQFDVLEINIIHLYLSYQGPTYRKQLP